jgi:hypothetical protein
MYVQGGYRNEAEEIKEALMIEGNNGSTFFGDVFEADDAFNPYGPENWPENSSDYEIGDTDDSWMYSHK